MGAPHDGRADSAPWRAAAAAEVALAVAVVLLDLVIPTLVLLALAAVSLLVRRERVATLGLVRLRRPGRTSIAVLALSVAWTTIQLGVVLPVLNHTTGRRQDLSQFDDLQGNLGLLSTLLVLSWTLAAFGEELACRGYVQTRLVDAFGRGRTGVVLSVLASSALFGLAHTEQGLVGVAVTFLDEVFFGVLRLRMAAGLWASVLAHGFNNTIGLVGFFLLGPIYGLW